MVIDNACATLDDQGLLITKNHIIQLDKLALSALFKLPGNIDPAKIKDLDLNHVQKITAPKFFCTCKNLKHVYGLELISISESAFEGCTKLKNSNLPKVATISKRAFAECTSLKRASSMITTKIDEGAFFRCTGLSVVNFPEVTMIGQQAFGSCSNLTSISLPKLKNSCSSPFMLCSKLSNITIGDTLPAKSTFSGCCEKGELYVGKNFKGVTEGEDAATLEYLGLNSDGWTIERP